MEVIKKTFYIILLFSCGISYASEPEVDKKVLICVDGITYPGIEALIDIENGFRRQKGIYLEDHDLDFFIQNQPTNLTEKNEYLKTLHNHARKYFYQSDKKKLELVYNAILEVIELNDELDYIKKLRGRDLTKHYFDYQNWYDRYATMVEIICWRWRLGIENNVTKDLKKFKIKYDYTFSFFPSYLEDLQDTDDALPIRVGKFPIDLEGWMLLTLSSLDRQSNIISVIDYLNDNGATIEKMEDELEYLDFHVNSMNEYLQLFDGKLDERHYSSLRYYSVVFLEQRYLYRDALLKLMLGKTIDSEMKYLLEIRDYTRTQCTSKLWNIYSAWIVDLAMKGIKKTKKESACETYQQLIRENIKYLSSVNKNIYVQSTLKNLHNNIHTKNYCINKK